MAVYDAAFKVGKSLWGNPGSVGEREVACTDVKGGGYTALSLIVNSSSLLLEFVRMGGLLDNPIEGLPLIPLDMYLDSGKRTLETVKKYGIKLTDEEMAYLIACSL
jgi:hypothetical protein